MYRHIFLMLLHMRAAYSILNNSRIVHHCSNTCAEESRGSFGFNPCMKSCVFQRNISWPLNGTDMCSDNDEDPQSKNRCSAKEIWKSLYIVTDTSGETRQYLIVYWKPCALELEHIKGYKISLHKTTTIAGYYDGCIRLELSRKLKQDDKNAEFVAFFSDFPLDYDTQYRITVSGLPLQLDDIEAHIDFNSASCSYLNGHDSCFCGLTKDKALPRPNITVSGYNVTISIQPLKSCFHVNRYVFVILSVRCSDCDDHSTSRTLKFRKNLNAKETLTESFYPLYPEHDKPNAIYSFKYRAIGISSSYAESTTTIHIVQWNPCRPNIGLVGSDLNVYWCCAPAVYNIVKYEMRVSCNESQFNVYTFIASCMDHHNMSARLKSLSPGFYSAQIREWRDPKYNVDAMWSSVSNTVELKTPTAIEAFLSHVVVVASVIIAFIIIAASVVTILCCRRKNFCRKVQRLPDTVRFAIGRYPNHSHVCKTVWVVWQADIRSNSTSGKVHSENVRHLASFLANRCGLNVILDQYEVTTAPSLSSWLTEKQKMADTVVFVCPHQPVTKYDSTLNQLVGNFLSVYNLYESALLFENFSVKFASVVLPYSCPKVYSEAKLLLHKVPSFKLMDEIDNLYFFIQNRAKAGPYGRCILEYVNGRDYSKTEEGAKLQAGFQEMVQILSRDDQTVDDPVVQETVLVSDHNLQERQLEIRDIDDQVNLLQRRDQFEPEPPPPIMPLEDADHTLYLINTSDLLSQRPYESESIEAVTFDSNCPLLQPSPIATMSF